MKFSKFGSLKIIATLRELGNDISSSALQRRKHPLTSSTPSGIISSLRLLQSKTSVLIVFVPSAYSILFKLLQLSNIVFTSGSNSKGIYTEIDLQSRISHQNIIQLLYV